MAGINKFNTTRPGGKPLFCVKSTATTAPLSKDNTDITFASTNAATNNNLAMATTS